MNTCSQTVRSSWAWLGSALVLGVSVSCSSSKSAELVAGATAAGGTSVGGSSSSGSGGKVASGTGGQVASAAGGATGAGATGGNASGGATVGNAAGGATGGTGVGGGSGAAAVGGSAGAASGCVTSGTVTAAMHVGAVGPICRGELAPESFAGTATSTFQCCATSSAASDSVFAVSGAGYGPDMGVTVRTPIALDAPVGMQTITITCGGGFTATQTLDVRSEFGVVVTSVSESITPGGSLTVTGENLMGVTVSLYSDGQSLYPCTTSETSATSITCTVPADLPVSSDTHTYQAYLHPESCKDVVHPTLITVVAL